MPQAVFKNTLAAANSSRRINVLHGANATEFHNGAAWRDALGRLLAPHQMSEFVVGLAGSWRRPRPPQAVPVDENGLAGLPVMPCPMIC